METLILVVPAKAVVGTVKVLDKFALLDDDPEATCSVDSKVPFLL
jgi:hypothetical protein